MAKKTKMDKKVWVPALIGLIAAYYAYDMMCAYCPRINGHWAFVDLNQRWDFRYLDSPYNILTPFVSLIAFIVAYYGVKSGMGKSKIDEEDII